MQLVVIGSGYVGLVAGAGFAEFGSQVTGVDIDAARVASLSRGELPIYEPMLPELVQSNMDAGRLRFTTDLPGSLSQAEVIFICVGTPPGPDGDADLSQVFGVADRIGAFRSPRFTLVVIKSTVPVGTSERVGERIAAGTGKGPFVVVSNPEFLKEGTAVEDFMRPMRILAGIGPAHGGPVAELRERAQQIMRRLYAPIVRTNDRLLVCDARSAELCKYASNAYLAMRVSFINEIASLAERVGADVEAVRRGMGMDTRIGPQFLFPGLGYGGSCFPKDTQALSILGRSLGLPLHLVEATQVVNQQMRTLMFDKILTHLGDGQQSLAGKRIAVWGLSFKPETDDLRDAPALSLIERIVQADGHVIAHDPVAMPHARALLRPFGSRVELAEDEYAAARGADALLLCTEWRQYRQPDFALLRQTLRGDALFDGRNIWDPEHLRELGFRYFGVGRSLPLGLR